MATTSRAGADSTEADWQRVLVTWLVTLACITAIFSFIPVAAKSKYQFVVLPCVLFALWRVRICGERVPRLVVVLGALAAAAGGLVVFSQVNLAPGAFVVSTVGENNLRQETKIYRDRLKRSIASADDSLVGGYPEVIRDSKTALRVLARSTGLGGVIWGNSRWMSAVLRQYPPLALSSFQDDSVARVLLRARGVPDLLLVRSIPFVGLSHGEERASVYFLGAVIKSWQSVPRMISPRAESGEFEGALESVGRTQARWSSRSHIAFPLWLSGTTHIVRAAEAPALQLGELTCALSQLREALSVFRGRDNPALEMAVRNNYAVALLLQAEYSPEPLKLQKKAYRQLAVAMKLRSHDQKVGAVVAINYLGLAHAKKGGVSHGRNK